jgi:aryl-alcohol dehydrogenase-like predicted oxidoreductase
MSFQSRLFHGDAYLGAARIVHRQFRALERRCANFFDTADVYGAGHSERVLARALAGRRQQVVPDERRSHASPGNVGQALGTKQADASDSGFRTIAQVEENCAALRHGPLTAEQTSEINGLLER